MAAEILELPSRCRRVGRLRPRSSLGASRFSSISRPPPAPGASQMLHLPLPNLHLALICACGALLAAFFLSLREEASAPLRPRAGEGRGHASWRSRRCWGPGGSSPAGESVPGRGRSLWGAVAFGVLRPHAQEHVSHVRTKPRERRHPRSAARLEQAQAAGVFRSVFMTQAGEDVVRARLCLLLLLLLPLRRKGQRRAGRPAGSVKATKAAAERREITKRNASVVSDAELLRKWCGVGASAARRCCKPRAAAVPAG